MEKTQTNSNSGSRNRRKGHDFERKLARVFREELGYSYCKTARQASRLLDECKVDLFGIPYNVQAKKVKSGINYSKLFEEMDRLLKENFPPGSHERTHPKVVFHSKGRKKTEQLVIMQQDEYIELLKRVKENEETI